MARGNTFPHPPRAFNLPVPPPPANGQLTGSWGEDAPPLIAPPEAQGDREARPEAPPFCRLRCRCCPTSAPAGRCKKAASAVPEWPSPSFTRSLNP
eukprot:scaffold7649_cov36-Phaeocystis_antarctica.AAC.1